jgi:hypothetical protein
MVEVWISFWCLSSHLQPRILYRAQTEYYCIPQKVGLWYLVQNVKSMKLRNLHLNCFSLRYVFKVNTIKYTVYMPLVCSNASDGDFIRQLKFCAINELQGQSWWKITLLNMIYSNTKGFWQWRITLGSADLQYFFPSTDILRDARVHESGSVSGLTRTAGRHQLSHWGGDWAVLV